MKAILTYHSIDEGGSPISVSPRSFAGHLAWLAARRVRVLSLADLVTHPADGPDAVALTFDDGFANILEPLQRLCDHGLSATVFVVSGHVGATNAWGRQTDPGIPTLPLLDWSNLDRLVRTGVSVEAHTRRHWPLTRLTDMALDDELQGCREDLRERLGIVATHLAYPYGDVDGRVAARAGACYRWGHTTAFHRGRASDHPLWLPRLDMYYFQRPDALDAWGTPAFTRRIAWIRARRAVRARLLGGWTPPAVPPSGVGAA